MEGKLLERATHAGWILMTAGFAVWSAGCGDEGPSSGPGVLSARVASSGAASGAVLIEFSEFITALDAGTATVITGPDTANRRFLIVLPEAGEIRFDVAVQDTTEPPSVSVLEIVDAENRLRSDVGAHRVEWVR